MKLVICDICKNEKKTNARDSFHCCNIRQPITRKNWLNQLREDDESKFEDINNSEVENTEELKKEAVIGLKPQKTALELKEETLEIIEGESEQELQEDINYKCGECNNIFTSKDNFICPYCQTDWETEINGEING